MSIPNPHDYGPAVAAVQDFIGAEMDAPFPNAVISWRDTSDGHTHELTLSDLVSVTHLAASVLEDGAA